MINFASKSAEELVEIRDELFNVLIDVVEGAKIATEELDRVLSTIDSIERILQD